MSADKYILPGDRMPFKVTHITEDHSAESGGVYTVVDQLVRRLVSRVQEVNIVCVRDNPMPPPDEVRLYSCHSSNFFGKYSLSGELVDRLRTIADDGSGSIFHIHGVWLASQLLGAKQAFKRNIPFVLTSHAMLIPWFWNDQGWKKRLKKTIYWNLIAKSAFRKASVIHAITDIERDCLRKLFPLNRIEVIPNAIDLDLLDIQIADIHCCREPMLLFLGRIHPQKGIDLLIKAFSKANPDSKWRLVIAGPVFSKGYYNLLRKLVSDLGMEKRIEFAGPVFDLRKWELVNKAWATVLPSRTECIGMVNLESAACGTPTVTTSTTGLSTWNESGGVLIDPDVDQLASALKKVTSWSDAEHGERGEMSRNFIEKNYSLDVIIPRWLELYRSMLQ